MALSKADWVEAALLALARDGLSGVAVEPLARTLGATKGSFYWHFADRDELLAAMLARWRDRHTEAIIADADGEPDPARRLRRLFDRVMTSASGTARPLELSLLASIDRPEVAAALREVTERRVGFVAECYEQLGLAQPRARQAAVLAYSVFAGLLHAQRASDGHLLDGLDPADYLRFVEQTLAIGPLNPTATSPTATNPMATNPRDPIPTRTSPAARG